MKLNEETWASGVMGFRARFGWAGGRGEEEEGGDRDKGLQC